jgi:hypothetical protein
LPQTSDTMTLKPIAACGLFLLDGPQEYRVRIPKNA